MEFDQMVIARRTIQAFSKEEVNLEVVLSALRLSLWAPNHKKTWPWVFTIVEAAARRQMIDLAIELKRSSGELNEVQERALRESLLSPSYWISLGIKRSDPKGEHEDYATLACSVQIASLELWRQGIGSKWSTAGFTLSPRTYDILGLDSKQVLLEGCLLVGMPARIPPPVERPALEQFLRYSSS